MRHWILIGLLFLSGCAGGTQSYGCPGCSDGGGYNIAPSPPVEDSWIGAPLDHLIFAWGQPTTVKIRNYGENLVDADSNSQLLDVYSWVRGNCITSFYVSNDRVAGWEKAGNCPN